MQSALLALLLGITSYASAFDPAQLAPAKILGKYKDTTNTVTGLSWVVDMGDGIAVVRVPAETDNRLITSLWDADWGKTDCSGIVRPDEGQKFATSDFCRALRDAKYDEPGFDAYTFGDADTATRKCRGNVIARLLSLGTMSFYSSATTTFLVPEKGSNKKLKMVTRQYGCAGNVVSTATITPVPQK